MKCLYYSFPITYFLTTPHAYVFFKNVVVGTLIPLLFFIPFLFIYFF